MVASVRHFGCSRSRRHRFQRATFSPSSLQSSVFKKYRFQIAPLWRAFSNGSVFGDRFQRCSVDDSRIRSKTAPFSFENGLVWTGPNSRLRQRPDLIQRKEYGMGWCLALSVCTHVFSQYGGHDVMCIRSVV